MNLRSRLVAFKLSKLLVVNLGLRIALLVQMECRDSGMFFDGYLRLKT